MLRTGNKVVINNKYYVSDRNKGKLYKFDR